MGRCRCQSSDRCLGAVAARTVSGMDLTGQHGSSTDTRPSAITEPPGESDEAALRALVRDIETGFNEKRPDILDHAFTEDAVVVVPDGTLIQGWSDLVAYHTRRLSSVVHDWRIRASVLGITRVDRDTAIVHMRQNMLTPERSFANHGTIVAVRREGRWWIAALHNTNVEQ